MAHRPRTHCTACQSELARILERGTVRLCLDHASAVYALANGAHLVVCRCGRRNLLRRPLGTHDPADVAMARGAR